MVDENAVKPQQQSALQILLAYSERIAKALPVFLGSIYILGFVITARRLAEYNVPISKFFDAQYFAAGTLTGLLFWITAWTVIRALNYEPRNTVLGWPSIFWAYVFFCILYWVYFALTTFGGVEIPNALTRSLLWDFLRIAIGEFTLWIIVAGIKNWRAIIDLQRSFRITSKLARSYNYILGLIAIFLLGIPLTALCTSASFLIGVQLPLSGIELYDQIPQSYGGGKQTIVRLYVDGDKIPSELVSYESSGDPAGPILTLPLNLIFQTSTEYIVAPIGSDEDGINQRELKRAWVIKADAVYVVVSELDQE